MRVAATAQIHALTIEDLLNACKASRRAGGTDDFSMIVLTLQ